MDASVVMVVRSRERGEEARAEIAKTTGNTSLELMICDLSSLQEIRRFAQEFQDNHDRLDVLDNNAGAVFNKREVTVDGFERTIVVNYLAPFLLTHELLPILKSSAPSRVINITSGLHKSGVIDFEDLQSTKHYKGMTAYQNAKLMVLMFTYELARRLGGTRVTANVVHPGFVATNLGSNAGTRSSIMFKMVRPMQIPPEKGAETSVYLASSPEVEGINGKYFTKKQEQRSSELSYDLDLQRRLWDTTERMLGILWES
jgi:NAD(P)-dependent dehydrogenase (short-subunit alcohol dehydrogenase family)